VRDDQRIDCQRPVSTPWMHGTTKLDEVFAVGAGQRRHLDDPAPRTRPTSMDEATPARSAASPPPSTTDEARRPTPSSSRAWTKVAQMLAGGFMDHRAAQHRGRGRYDLAA
jgi:hypothetical protein